LDALKSDKSVVTGILGVGLPAKAIAALRTSAPENHASREAGDLIVSLRESWKLGFTQVWNGQALASASQLQPAGKLHCPGNAVNGRKIEARLNDSHGASRCRKRIYR
jgi:hypothetical protein